MKVRFARFAVLLAAVIAVATVCLLKTRAPTFNDRAKKVLENATRIEVFRISRDAQIDPKLGSVAVTEYGQLPIIGSASIDQDQKTRILAVLRDRNTFARPFTKRCGFDPGVVFRIWSGNESVDALVCLTCGEIRMDSLRAQMDANRAEIVRIAKSAFPDDRDVQGVRD